MILRTIIISWLIRSVFIPKSRCNNTTSHFIEMLSNVRISLRGTPVLRQWAISWSWSAILSDSKWTLNLTPVLFRKYRLHFDNLLQLVSWIVYPFTDVFPGHEARVQLNTEQSVTFYLIQTGLRDCFTAFSTFTAS